MVNRNLEIKGISLHLGLSSLLKNISVLHKEHLVGTGVATTAPWLVYIVQQGHWRDRDSNQQQSPDV